MDVQKNQLKILWKLLTALKVLNKKVRKDRKNLYSWTNSGPDTVKERISELEENSEKFSRSTAPKEKERKMWKGA